MLKSSLIIIIIMLFDSQVLLSEYCQMPNHNADIIIKVEIFEIDQKKKINFFIFFYA